LQITEAQENAAAFINRELSNYRHKSRCQRMISRIGAKTSVSINYTLFGTKKSFLCGTVLKLFLAIG